MRKIAVAISKGGTGKTTTAVNLAAGLVKVERTVLLVDTDTQGQAGRALGIDPGPGLAELMAEEIGAEAALVEARPGLSILRGGRRLAATKSLITIREIRREAMLADALKPYENRFDYVLLDTGPNWDSLTVNVLAYAEEIIAPVSMEALAVDGMVSFLQNVKEAKRQGLRIEVNYLLPTLVDGRVKKSEEILSQLEKHFDAKAVCQPIPYSVKLSEAAGWGKTIYEYARRDRGAAAYAKLTRRVVEDE